MERCRHGRLCCARCPRPATVGHEPRPYCNGEGCDRDIHDHPARFMQGSLAAIHFRWGVPLEDEQIRMIDFECIPVGRARPEQDFPIGSEWHYGPCYENMETRVRVVAPPRQSVGRKPLRDSLGFRRGDGSYAEGPRSWFVECEVVISPWYAPGQRMGLPPCALIPAVAVDAERGACRCECHAGWNGCCCRCTSVEPPHVTITRLQCENDRLAIGLEQAKQNAAHHQRAAERALSRERALRTKIEQALR